jgi:hypothetical protein
MQRPCVLPKVQIDDWRTPAPTQAVDASQLADEIFCHGQLLLCKSLLRGLKHGTLMQIVKALHTLQQDIRPKVENGQVYLHDGWRLRWDDMHDRLRTLVSHVRLHDSSEFKKQVLLRFHPLQVEQCVFRVIGPAREAGVRALRRHLMTTHPLPCTAQE